jgi:prefoldin subunit 5
MSSPLDSRMRVIAREEVAALLGTPKGVQADGDSTPTAEQMQQQITDLHEHLHHAATTISRLSARIDTLEKAAGRTDQEERPATRRTARKTTTPE